ncbi:MAG: hypothetical protein R6X09_10350 [Bacteroidales bacterium]
MIKQTRRRFLPGALPVTPGTTFGFTDLSATGNNTRTTADKKPEVPAAGGC